jgi:hypothetical protein
MRSRHGSGLPRCGLAWALLLLLAACQSAPDLSGFPPLLPAAALQDDPAPAGLTDDQLARLVDPSPAVRRREQIRLWNAGGGDAETLLAALAQAEGVERDRLLEAALALDLQSRLPRRTLYDHHLHRLASPDRTARMAAHGNLLAMGPLILPWVEADLQRLTAGGQVRVTRSLQVILRSLRERATDAP